MTSKKKASVSDYVDAVDSVSSTINSLNLRSKKISYIRFNNYKNYRRMVIGMKKMEDWESVEDFLKKRPPEASMEVEVDTDDPDQIVKTIKLFFEENNTEDKEKVEVRIEARVSTVDEEEEI
jgi:hypothetical protein